MHIKAHRLDSHEDDGSQILIILSAGVPQTITALGFKHFLNGYGCKFLLYIQGFLRSVSINMTCLLSIFQVLTIVPGNPVGRIIKSIIGFCSEVFFSVLTASSNGSMIAILQTQAEGSTHAQQNGKNVTRKLDFEYCCFEGQGIIGNSFYTALVVSPEFFFFCARGLVQWLL
ncbi:hypothetical protein A6R68_24099, partial [Neotoma lepida]